MISVPIDGEFKAEHICLLWQNAIRPFYPLHPLFTDFDPPQKFRGLVFFGIIFFVNWGPT